MKVCQRLVMASLAVLVLGVASEAGPPPEASLSTCQAAVQKSGKVMVQNTVNAVGKCLRAVAIDVIRKGDPISSGTSRKCVAQFRKLHDTRVPARSLEQKLTDAVDKKCTPLFTPGVTHTLNDITAHAGGGVAEKINTANIDLWCTHHSGDGSIDSVSEWEECMIDANNCAAAVAILNQFPRALEWIIDLQAGGNMPAVASPPSDPSKTSDAVAGAALFEAALDPDSDTVPNPTCGGETAACVKGCCYVETAPGPTAAETTCFEWTGPGVRLPEFLGTCAGGTHFSLPSGAMVAGAQIPNSAAGPCVAGPIYGTSCSGPPNLVTLPVDSVCPVP